MNDYPYIGVCLFIWCTYSFVCVIRKSILEVDCELDEPNTFEDDPQDTFEQEGDEEDFADDVDEN